MLILIPSVFWTIVFTAINGMLLFWLFKKAIRSVLAEYGIEPQKKDVSVKKEDSLVSGDQNSSQARH